MVLDELFPLEAQVGNKLNPADMADDAIKNVGQKERDKGDLLEPENRAGDDNDYYERAKSSLGLPVDLFEARIANRADHQHCNHQQKNR